MTHRSVSRQIGSSISTAACLALILALLGTFFNFYGVIAAPLNAPADPAPGAATLTSPTGTVITEPVTFTWGQVATATWYKVVVTKAAVTVHSQWYYSSATLCVASSCAVTPVLTLTQGGAYSWTVQTWNPNGYGPVSSVSSFTFYRLPSAPVQTSPYFRISTYAPTFVWNAVLTATGYQLQVMDPSGATILDAAYGSGVCTGTVCQVTPALTLTAGPHRWRVNATNPAGTGAYSDWMDFATPLGAATLVSPSGDWIIDPVAYTWNEVVSATWYKLNVKNAAGVDVINDWYQASVVCAGGVCTTTPAVTLTNGEAHTWNILPWNESWGYGVWATALSFTPYRIPDVPTLVSPEGCIDIYNPTYTWNKVTGATQYAISVTGTSALSTTVNAADVCSGTTCTTALSSLLSGPYSWTVSAINPAGSSAASAAMNFSTPMAKPTLTVPTGDVILDPVTFTWSDVAQAENYNLEILTAAGGVVYSTSFSQAAVCAAGTCTTNIAVATMGLTSGTTYSWHVQPTKTCAIGSGTGLWSDSLSFTFWAIPAAPTLTSPTGCIDNFSPTYTWNAVSDATSYTVSVNGPSTTSAVVYPTSCTGGVCTTTLATLVSGAYTWTVTASNPAGSTPSLPMAFSTPLTPVTLVSPNAATIIIPSVTFNWNAVVQGESYILEVIASTGTTVFTNTYTAATLGCPGGAGTCSITETAAALGLTSGDTYTWRVQAMKTCGGGSENSAWSSTMSFTYYAVPSAPTLTAPSGCITNYAPTYTWNKEAGVLQYTITVTGPSAPALVTLNASAICSGATCSTTLSTLVTGNYSWIVTAINPAGSTPSAAMTFTTPMAKPTLTSPSGNWITDPVVYTWNEVTLADSYTLEIINAAGTTVFTSSFSGSSICAGGVCSVTPGATLTNGEQHTWRVQPSNAACSAGTWSDPMSFIPYRVPDVPTLVSPAADTCTASYTPTYAWNKVTGATAYNFTLSGPSVSLNTWYDASTVCSGATCSVTPAGTLTTGAFTWNITAYNPAGSTPGVAITFYTPMTAPVITPFASDMSLTNPVVYQWSAIPSATWYKVEVTGTEGVVVNEWFDAAAICSGGTCSATPSITLINGGTYTWRVIAWNSACGYSPWSTSQTFTAYRIPDAPVLVSPSGCITTNQPTYTWNTVQGSTQYQLYVNNPGGVDINTWYTPGSGGLTCTPGGTCTITPPTILGGGLHTWWVKSYNPAGSTWSSGTGFTTPYPASTLSTPSGTTTTTPVVYTFSEVPTATQYRLRVQDDLGAEVHNQLYTVGVDATCSGGNCSITPALTLTNGALYTWSIQAVTSCGAEGWSSGKSFTWYTTPAAPTLLSPMGCYPSNQPTYIWNVVTGATMYKLWVSGPSGVLINTWYTPGSGGLICSGATCSINPTVTLPSGDYTWYVLSYNPAGSTWSAAATFSIAGTPAAPLSPSGNWVTTPIVYTWSQVSGATQYQLQVQDSGGSDVINTLYTIGVEVTCAGGNCSVTPGVALTGGATYTWRVQAVTSCGAGSWSSTLTFTYITVPAAPVLVAPTGSISTNHPTYIWNPAVGATTYLLWVNSPSGNVIQIRYNASAICSSSTCSATPAVTLLASTAYTWWVRSENSVGDTWSASLSFTTPATPPVALPAPRLVSPANGSTVTSNPPSFSWNAVTGATGYWLDVIGPSGYIISAFYAVGVDVACTGGTCTVASPTSFENGEYSWNVTAYSSSTGAWSSPSTTWHFNVQAPPGPTTLILPSGDIDTDLPIYYWYAVPGATSYIITISGAGNSYTHEYLASDICSGGICTVSPVFPITPNVEYTWKVQTRNSVGYGPWSVIFRFTYVD